MLPSRICDACREGKTDDVISWLKKNEKKELWSDDVDDDWIMFPAFVEIEEAVDREELHITRTYLCMHQFGFYGHEQAIETMLKEFAIEHSDEHANDQDTYRFFQASLLSWVVDGAAESGQIQLIQKLQMCHSHYFDASDAFLGGCRGNQSNIVKQFSNNHRRKVRMIELFGVDPQCIELFAQYTPDPPFPFLHALLTRDFQQAREIFYDLERLDQYDAFDNCMCSAGHMGDIETMKHLLQFFDEAVLKRNDEQFYLINDRDQRACVIEKCAVQIITYGHKHALDWIISVLPHSIVFDDKDIYQSIQCRRTDLLVRLNQGNKTRLAPEYVATYLNYGGRVQNRYQVDVLRHKKQQSTQKCLMHVLTDKRAIQCVILNAISFE